MFKDMEPMLSNMTVISFHFKKFPLINTVERKGQYNFKRMITDFCKDLSRMHRPSLSTDQTSKICLKYIRDLILISRNLKVYTD